MKQVAVFGNAGAGKSTLAKELARLTRLPLYPLDMIQFSAGGAKVPRGEYLKAHADLLGRDAWIIDGFGCLKSAWERFAAADTLLHRSAPTHPLPMGHEALPRGDLRDPRGLARGQSDDQQHYPELSCAMALSSELDP